MKNIKKFLIILMVMLVLLPFAKIKIEADEVPLERADGNGYVTYIGSNVQVTIPDKYELPDTAFRAVWVSAFTSDVTSFTNEAQYKREIISVLEVMEEYNMNAMIFHIRAKNDAIYESKYNKWSQYYSTDPSWDALPWIIEECHRRGIEFHAWLNPYRVATSGSANLETLSKNFKSTNPASNPDNLLNADTCVILNPGLPNVRDFLIRTCMEVIENYDVDAINFDDYFYAAGVDDADTYAKYNPDNLSLADWRREQINLFIEGLSKEMREFNERTGRRVQLGIAPSGIWRSGDGKVTYDSEGNAITNGSSTTSSFIHYGGHLFADTLKWINEEWIDYILPQTYWSIEHGSAGFPDLVDWWAKVVKHKNVNLYVSMGLYMRGESGASSWNTNNYEAYNQIMYSSKWDTVKGMSVYTYKNLKESSSIKKSFYGVDELWSKPVLLPEVRTMDPIIVEDVKNVKVGKVDNGYRIQFDEVEGGKFYGIYRSKDEVTFDPSELIDVIGNCSYDGIVNYVDLIDNSNDYHYGIIVQSNSLTQTKGVKFTTKDSEKVEKAPLDKVSEILVSSNTVALANVDVKFDLITHSFGEDIKYDLYYSTDQENWNLNSVSIDTTKGTGYGETKLQIPTNCKNLYVKVKAYNNVGESYSDIKTIAIHESCGTINHFAYFGNAFSEKEVEFVWNNRLDLEGVKYTLQESLDSFNYIDVKEVTQTGDINIRTTFKLPKEIDKYYYRVKAEYQGKIAYSDVLTINIKGDFGSIDDFKINNKEPEMFYVGKEGEYIIAEFTQKTSSAVSITYTSRLSRDLDNWILANKFSTKNKTETNGDKCEQYIYLSETDLKMYYYLEVNMGDKTSKTDIFEIYVIPEIIFPDDFSEYMSKEQESIIDKLNMFNN